MLYLAGSLLFGSGSARAQDPAPLPEKEVVVVDLFARNRTVPAVYVEAVRQQVLSAFADRGRHRIVDGEAPGMLAGPPAGWGFVDPATVASAQSEFLQNRMQAMQDAGARYVVTGAIADYKFEHVSLPADSKKTPRPGFRATFQVILSAYDLKLGVPVPDQVYQLRGDAPVAEDADRKALSTLYGQLEYYIDRNFKFETAILQLAPADPRKGVQELYIHSGTYMGVKPGDLFMVYEEIPVGGVITRQKVGKLRVNDVGNPTVAKCKITKGNDEIADAFLAGRGLICVSDSKALFY